MTDADRIIAAVRSRGNDPRDLRDAAHEACHALMFGVKPGRWDREVIHAAIGSPRKRILMAELKYGPRIGTLVDAEIVARAVEQLVCRRLGVDCGTVEHWAHIAWMEAMQRSRLLLPHDGTLPRLIHVEMGTGRTEMLADKVMALKPWSPRRKRTGGSTGADRP